VFVPKPLYDAMFLFAYAGGGWLVPIHTRGIRPRLPAFAVRGTGDEHRIILVNTDLAQNEHVRIATTGQKATILRLTAHSVESKSGLTFGEASIDLNGDWAPRAAQSVRLQANRFVVDVPAASAAVVQIHTA
jgi:glycosyl hydrolase family 79